MLNSKDTYDYLLKHNIKPSVQRLAVMGYLLDHRTHPAVDEIYNALKVEVPTLSKTTVYNTLRLLVDHGAALMLHIDETKSYFDAETRPHAHFYCTQCGRVYDIPATERRIRHCATLPKGFSVTDMELTYRGICPCCEEKKA